jgi:hypothetical protein
VTLGQLASVGLLAAITASPRSNAAAGGILGRFLLCAALLGSDYGSGCNGRASKEDRPDYNGGIHRSLSNDDGKRRAIPDNRAGTIIWPIDRVRFYRQGFELEFHHRRTPFEVWEYREGVTSNPRHIRVSNANGQDAVMIKHTFIVCKRPPLRATTPGSRTADTWSLRAGIGETEYDCPAAPNRRAASPSPARSRAGQLTERQSRRTAEVHKRAAADVSVLCGSRLNPVRPALPDVASPISRRAPSARACRGGGGSARWRASAAHP